MAKYHELRKRKLALRKVFEHLDPCIFITSKHKAMKMELPTDVLLQTIEDNGIFINE